MNNSLTLLNKLLNKLPTIDLTLPSKGERISFSINIPSANIDAKIKMDSNILSTYSVR